MSLLDRLRVQIESSGPIAFEEFMAACLYDRDFGFFATGRLRSARSGDFLTSPEVSPWFGRTLGHFVHKEQARLETAGRRFGVADIGAGSGSLLSSMLGVLEELPDVWAADVSPAARASLARHDGWTVVDDQADIPDRFSGVILANELLDNLPAALVVATDLGWEERWVGLDGDASLALVAVPVRGPVAGWADSFAGAVPEGGLVEVQLAAGDWIESILGRLEAGSLVVIDYGGTDEELEPRRTRGTLRTYRAHHLGPDPLLAPGETDLTVDVNFTALIAIAERAGATVELHRQDEFLRQWNLGDAVERMRREELELARGGSTIDRLRVRSERTDAETLLHPRGLGDFRVLVATKH